jgi:hypothetical protein
MPSQPCFFSVFEIALCLLSLLIYFTITFMFAAEIRIVITLPPLNLVYVSDVVEPRGLKKWSNTWSILWWCAGVKKSQLQENLNCKKISTARKSQLQENLNCKKISTARKSQLQHK